MIENDDDLIRRLNTMAETGWNPIGGEAADRIKALRSRVDEQALQLSSAVAQLQEANERIEGLKIALDTTPSAPSVDDMEWASKAFLADADKTIERLTAECDALRKDADRYRHLRDDYSIEVDDDGTLGIGFGCSFNHHDDIDASVDESMQLKREREAQR